MVLPIVAYGDPILRKKCKEVDPDSYREGSSVKELISHMWETMYQANGVGLAAPQVGECLRIFLVDTKQVLEDKEPDPDSYRDDSDGEGFEGEKGIKKAFINPIIIETSGDEWEYNEGCLSIPTIREDIERPEKVIIEYFDEDFNLVEEEFSGLNGRVIQHEYDHIEGVLFTDHLKPLKRRMLKKKLENISKGKVTVDYKMRFPMLKKR